MGQSNIMRLLQEALRNGTAIDTDGDTLKVLPTADDSGALNVGDGTTDVDVKIFLGSSTEYVEFDVGNSRVNFEAPIRIANGGAVTQASSITTGVTLNTQSGQITTVSQTVAAAAEATFTVTNSVVTGTTDVVVVNVATNSGNGTFQAFVTDVQAGQFNITLANLHASAAGNSALVINFAVLQASTS